MATSMVIGTQWGDEGKGKIVDCLAEAADVVGRRQSVRITFITKRYFIRQ